MDFKELRVKVNFNSTIRRFKLDPVTFKNLQEMVSNICGGGKHCSFIMTYKDDENEFITIQSQCDLREAVEVLEEMDLKSLKIYVELVEKNKENKENKEVDDYSSCCPNTASLGSNLSKQSNKAKEAKKVEMKKEAELCVDEAKDYLCKVLCDFTSDRESMEKSLRDVFRLLESERRFEVICSKLVEIVLENKCVSYIVSGSSKYGSNLELLMKSLRRVCDMNNIGDELGESLKGRKVNFDDLLFLCEIGFPLSRPYSGEDILQNVSRMVMRIEGIPCGYLRLLDPMIRVIEYYLGLREVIERRELVGLENAGKVENIERMEKVKKLKYKKNWKSKKMELVNREYMEYVKARKKAEYLKKKEAEKVFLNDKLKKVLELRRKKEKKEKKDKKEKKFGFHILKVGKERPIVGNGGSIVFKSWVVYNNCENKWPGDCRLCLISGDDIVLEKEFDVKCVDVGEASSVRVALVIPEKIGKYSARFQMKTGGGIRFGPILKACVLSK